tara:strand:+ start:91 stop:1221 length:1131 start_codon:yes stop_codon:yes gene_type:complete
MKKFLTVLSIIFLLTIPTNVSSNQDDNNPNTFEYKTSIFSSTADIVDKVIPSVVYIYIEQRVATEEGDNDFGGLMPPRGVPITGVGTGFFINDEGYIVTNAHVVEGAQDLTIYYWSSPLEFNKAQIIGVDAIADIAVIKIEPLLPTPYVEWGDSEKVRLGEDVVAIGHGMSMPWSVTKGIISYTHRQKPGSPMIVYNQSDAVINQGNSGGPLFNMNGEVIGVNTLLFSQTGSFSGVGFSLPSVLAERSVRHIMNTAEYDSDGNITKQGFVTYPAIGIMVTTVETKEERQELLDKGIKSIVIIDQTPEDGAAYEAGLLKGDIITFVDGNEIITSLDLIKQLWYNEIGDTVDVVVIRNDEKLTIPVTLKEFKFAKEGK